jgi:hypothetical protein
MSYSKDELLEIGINKLRTFGFVNVTKNNVFEDEVYLYHFKKFMSFLLGQNGELDTSIKELFTSIDKKNETN